MDGKKIFAMAVVAAFCIAAFASVDLGDASDAASQKYEVYVEEIDAKGAVTNTAFVYFESDADVAKYIEAANKAFNAAGLTKLKLEADTTYGIKVNYGGSGSNAVFYSDGKGWVQLQDGKTEYTGHAKVGLAVGNGYIATSVYEALTEAEKSHWEATSMADPWAYMKVLETAGTFDKIMNYKVNLTVVDDDLVKTSKASYEFTSENEGGAWCYAFNEAVKGNSIFSRTAASFSGTAISINYDGSGSNAMYEKTGGKWVSVQNTLKSYTSGNELDFELNNGYITTEQFGKLSSSEQKNWKETGWGDPYAYMRNPSADSSSGGDFPIIYVVVAIVAILLIACAAYYLMKNKKTA